MILHHFVSHISEIGPTTFEGGYYGRHLVHGKADATQVCGYAHAMELYLPVGKKLVSHWHPNRENVFYCLSGEGVFFLGGIERRVGPGDGMFIPLGALHGGINLGVVDLGFFDSILPTERPSPLPVGEACFANIERAPTTTERGATVKTLFPRETYGNSKIEWWGEIRLEPGQEIASGRYEGAEQILYVLEGHGLLHLWDKEVALRPGSIAYIVAGATHAVANTGQERMRIVGSRSQIGRVPTPEYYKSLAW